MIEHPIYLPKHEDVDYPEPQENVQVPLKDNENINNLNDRKLSQQNIKSSFRMILGDLSRSINGRAKSLEYSLNSLIGECKTEGGYTCKFPFKYDGKTYNACTDAGGYSPWCYQKEGNWGYCKTGDCFIRVNGGWSKWGTYGHCSQSCGKGRKNRFRLCNKPEPMHGGNDCSGFKSQSESCFLRDCADDEELWPVEVQLKGCKKGTEQRSSVSTQIECQEICLDLPKCIGISYSDNPVIDPDWSGNRCVTCTDDELGNASGNKYGFYRKPGTSPRCKDEHEWCEKIDINEDCCSKFVKEACPGKCEECPGDLELPLLEMTANGESCLDAGAATLINSKQCELAANHYGNKFSGNIKDEDFPEGCIVKLSPGYIQPNYNRQVYWNENGKIALQSDSFYGICYKMPCNKDEDCPNMQKCVTNKVLKSDVLKVCECVDNPNGYDGYDCQTYGYDRNDYCNHVSSNIWYERFSAACRKACGRCKACLDDPDGYKEHPCPHYASYCGETDTTGWYDGFRAACNKTCKKC